MAEALNLFVYFPKATFIRAITSGGGLTTSRAKASSLSFRDRLRVPATLPLRTSRVSVKFHAVIEHLPLGAMVSKMVLNLFPLIGDSPGRKILPNTIIRISGSAISFAISDHGWPVREACVGPLPSRGQKNKWTAVSLKHCR
jgi:hypothetical protein